MGAKGIKQTQTERREKVLHYQDEALSPWRGLINDHIANNVFASFTNLMLHFLLAMKLLN